MTTENNQNNENNEPCFFEKKVDFIKHNLLGQIYQAGIRQGFDMTECLDDHGELDPEDIEEFAGRAAENLELFKKFVDLVWDDDFEGFICDDCAQKLEDAETVEKLNEEFKKNSGQQK